MTEVVEDLSAPKSGPPEPKTGRGSDSKKYLSRLVRASQIQRVGALYVLAVIVVIFSIAEPSLFPTVDTLRSILNANSITALAALALIVPLATGVFDLSIGSTMALCSVVLSSLIVNSGVPVALALAITLCLAIVVGLCNALIVVLLGIDSFIGTLGTGGVLAAFSLLISEGQTITSAGLNSSLGDIATTEIFGLQTPVYVAILTAVILVVLLERTVTGRRLYAVGFNEEASRLAGVHTKRLRFLGLMTSAGVAGLAGMLLTAQVGSGNPEIGGAYLLDAFAAAFLGATQLRNGRFNAVGTLIAVLLLGTGTAGLTLIGAEAWTSDLFTGTVLIVALALTKLERESLAND